MFLTLLNLKKIMDFDSVADPDEFLVDPDLGSLMQKFVCRSRIWFRILNQILALDPDLGFWSRILLLIFYRYSTHTILYRSNTLYFSTYSITNMSQ